MYDITHVKFELVAGSQLPLQPGQTCRLSHAVLPAGHFESFTVEFELSSRATDFLDLKLRFAIAPVRGQSPPEYSSEFSPLENEHARSTNFFQGNDFMNRNFTFMRKGLRLDLSRKAPRDHVLVDIFNGSRHALEDVWIRGVYATGLPWYEPPREPAPNLSIRHMASIRDAAGSLGISTREAFDKAITLLNEHKLARLPPRSLDDLRAQLRVLIGAYPARVFGRAIEFGPRQSEGSKVHLSTLEVGHAILWLDDEREVRGLLRAAPGTLEKRVPRKGRGSQTALKLVYTLRRLDPSDDVCVPYDERLTCVREICAEFNVDLPSDETVEIVLERLAAITYGVRDDDEKFYIEPEKLDVLHMSVTESDGGSLFAW